MLPAAREQAGQTKEHVLADAAGERRLTPILELPSKHACERSVGNRYVYKDDSKILKYG